MVNFPNLVTVLAILATGLMAGLFYSYSCSVNPGLKQLPDMEYLSVMQSINKAILNPAFFVAFFGALVLLPTSAWLNYSSPATLRFWLLAAASVVYAIGLFGVTVIGNVPLNEMLDKLNLASASADEIAAMRRQFEIPWNTWHAVRTVCVLVSFALSVLAMVLRFPQES